MKDLYASKLWIALQIYCSADIWSYCQLKLKLLHLFSSIPFIGSFSLGRKMTWFIHFETNNLQTFVYSFSNKLFANIWKSLFCLRCFILSSILTLQCFSIKKIKKFKTVKQSFFYIGIVSYWAVSSHWREEWLLWDDAVILNLYKNIRTQKHVLVAK